MKTFSIPRKIWRIIYPFLIFVALSAVIGLFIGLGIGVYLGIREAASGAAILDQAALADEMQAIIIQYAPLLQLVSSIAGFAVFLPMWLYSRKQVPVYFNVYPIRNIFIIIGLFVSINILLVAIMAGTDIIRFFPTYEQLSEYLSGGSVLLQFIALGIAAPIVEELCFRGVLINRMRWLPVWVAVFIQAVLFGIAHLNLFQGIYAFLIGILLGVLYARFRSIILVIAAHMAFNSASVFFNALVDTEISVLLALVVSVLLTGLFTFLLVMQPKAELIFDPATASDLEGDIPDDTVE